MPGEFSGSLFAAGLMDDWPFDQPPDCGTIVSRAILDGRAVIQWVSHDADDHAWQFLDNDTWEAEQAALVCLSHILALDPSVREIADLEPGWIATRENSGAPWVRAKNDEENEA